MEVKTCKQKIINKNVTVSFCNAGLIPRPSIFPYHKLEVRTAWEWGLGTKSESSRYLHLPTDLVAAWVLALVLVHRLLGLGRVGRIDNGEVLIIVGWGSRGKWVGRLWRRRLGSEPLLGCLQFLCFLRLAGKQVERRRLIFSRARRACVRVNM